VLVNDSQFAVSFENENLSCAAVNHVLFSRFLDTDFGVASVKLESVGGDRGCI
jgi:hypothetical protein